MNDNNILNSKSVASTSCELINKSNRTNIRKMIPFGVRFDVVCKIVQIVQMYSGCPKCFCEYLRKYKIYKGENVKPLDNIVYEI